LYHPIEKKSAIAPPAPALLAAAKNLEITVGNENDLLLNLYRGDIQFYSDAGEDRRGWIVQQLFKLCVDEIADAYWVLARKITGRSHLVKCCSK
jgi:hypothetical protein